MSLWQPRSLQQLVLVSIFAALAPLCLAILFTVNTLGKLSETNLEVNHTVVYATRLGQEIQRDVLELERRARQYLALGDFELAELFEREREILLQKLSALQDAMPSQSPDVRRLIGSLDRIELPTPVIEVAQDEPNSGPSTDEFESLTTVESREQRVSHDFSVISDQGDAVKTWLLSSVDQMLASNAREARSLIENLTLQLLVLAAATLALLLFLAYWINKPVKALTQEIHQLGTSGLNHPIKISGPLELQAVGSELEWLRQSLQESEQQKEQFLRHISHELKTPLSSLREGADLLADQVTGHLSQQQMEIMEIVRHNGIELQRLIENLLDYNRLPSQDLTVEEFNLEEMWQNLLNNYNLALDKKALHLERQGHIDHWTADRDKLRTSLDNLLSNAVAYTPEGGLIDIDWRAENATLVVSVANSGEAIPAEDAERVFEPFFQSAAKRSGPIKGSGIGLSVARECIEAQGGTLTMADHPYLPVCFRLTCPAH